MVSVESFADYPMSVTEARAAKTDSASQWTPRDALVSMLRRIDNGEIKPDALVVVVREDFGDYTRTYFSNAAPDLHTSIGLLEHCKLRIYHNGEV